MNWNRQALALAVSALAVISGSPVAGYAQPKPAPVNANIINGPSNPVPVVVQPPPAQRLVSFTQGFTVPNGKRLLIDDVSVACTTVGANLADFRTSGLAVSALLRITYPRALCPEPLDSEGECHQLHSVGTARQTGIEPIFVMPPPDSRPAALLWASRQMSLFADAGASLVGVCDGVEVNFPPSFNFVLRGSGRLIDQP